MTNMEKDKSTHSSSASDKEAPKANEAKPPSSLKKSIGSRPHIINDNESKKSTLKRNYLRRILNTLQSQDKQEHESLMNYLRQLLRHHDEIVPTTYDAPPHVQEKLKTVVNLLTLAEKDALTKSEILDELENMEREFAKVVAPGQVVTETISDVQPEEHPYVVMQKQFENIGASEKQEFDINYRPFSLVMKTAMTTIPIYATSYDDERQRQARRREFLFGLKSDQKYDLDDDNLDDYLYDSEQKPESDEWRKESETQMAILAVVFGTYNLLRFPQLCYINGGAVFFLVYILLMMILAQPLVFFEMLIGQFSYNGEWGFGQLHVLSKGYRFALFFVNIIFFLLQSSTSSYTLQYAFYTWYYNPGSCIPEWNSKYVCIPYSNFQAYPRTLARRVPEINALSFPFRKYNGSYYLSTELFFRYFVYMWKETSDAEEFNWIYLLFFTILLLITSPASGRRSLVSVYSRIWVYAASTVPIILVVVFLHQNIFRRAYQTRNLFFVFHWNRLKSIHFWVDELDMVFSSVGLGYGVLVRISSRNIFRFEGTKKSSWVVCGVAIFYAFLCNLVVYSELSLLNDVAGTPDYLWPTIEVIGVTYTCLSGALVKFKLPWLVPLTFLWISMTTLFPLIISTQMCRNYVQDVVLPKLRRMSSLLSLSIALIVEVLIVASYLAYENSSKHDETFNIFGGTGAASSIVLIEIGIAFVLCGFREFMTNIEIMLDATLSPIFQIEMKYFVPYAIMVAIFVEVCEWYLVPSISSAHHGFTERVFHINVVLNLVPFLIMMAFYNFPPGSLQKILPIFFKTKVHPDDDDVIPTFRRQAVGRIIRRDTDRDSSKLNEIFLVPETIFPYNSHVDLKRRLRNLCYNTKIIARWMLVYRFMLETQRISSFPKLVRLVLLCNEAYLQKKEQRMAKILVRKASVVDLTTCTLEKMQGTRRDQQESILIDRLFEEFSSDEDFSDSTSYFSYSDSNCASISSSDSSEEEGHRESVTSSISSIPSSSSTFSKAVGKPIKSCREKRIELQYLIKKDLDLPCLTLKNRLERIREKRFLEEWAALCRFDGVPEEYFITLKVNRQGNQQFTVEIRVIVLPNDDHFVLKRLPIPRPAIIYATNEHIDSLPGVDKVHRIFQFLIQHPQLKKLLLSDIHQLTRRNNTVPLLSHLKSHVYGFINPLKSVIIVLEDEKVANRRANPRKWMTRPIRRLGVRRCIELPCTLPTPGLFPVTAANEDFHSGVVDHPPTIIHHVKDNQSGQSLKSKYHEKGKIPAADYPKTGTVLNQATLQDILSRTHFKRPARRTSSDVLVKRVKHLTAADWKQRTEEFRQMALRKAREHKGVLSENVRFSVLPEEKKRDKSMNRVTINASLETLSSVTSTPSSTSIKKLRKTKSASYMNIQMRSSDWGHESLWNFDVFSNLNNENARYSYSSVGKTLRIELRHKNK